MFIKNIKSKIYSFSDSNSCNSSICSSPPISPGCENLESNNNTSYDIKNVSPSQHLFPNMPPFMNFPHHYPNMEMFYHPRQFYYDGFDFNGEF